MLEPTHDLPLNESCATALGVRVERRCFFAVSAAAIAAAVAPVGAFARRTRESRAPLTYDEFLAEAVPMAKKLVGDTTLFGQDQYLLTLAACALRVPKIAKPELRPTGKGTAIGGNDTPDGCPFTVLHWTMDPGTKIGIHPHIYGNVVTLGLEGEALIQNFETVEPRDYESKKSFKVRRTVEQLLLPGHVNVVNLDRNYMHGFTAGPAGVRFVDITTRIREKRPTPNLELAGKPLDPLGTLFEASWVHT